MEVYAKTEEKTPVKPPDQVNMAKEADNDKSSKDLTQKRGVVKTL